MGLDVAGGSLETSGALIEMAVDVDVTKFPALEAGFVITEMVTSEGCIMVTAGPPDFSASNSGFFFFGQGG